MVARTKENINQNHGCSLRKNLASQVWSKSIERLPFNVFSVNDRDRTFAILLLTVSSNKRLKEMQVMLVIHRVTLPCKLILLHY